MPWALRHTKLRQPAPSAHLDAFEFAIVDKVTRLVYGLDVMPAFKIGIAVNPVEYRNGVDPVGGSTPIKIRA